MPAEFQIESGALPASWPDLAALGSGELAELLDPSDSERVQRVRGYRTELGEIEQVLGRALGYPRYADDLANFPDVTEADGVCVGDHTPESLAAEAAGRIVALASALRLVLECPECGGRGQRWVGRVEPWRKSDYRSCKCREEAWRALEGEG